MSQDERIARLETRADGQEDIVNHVIIRLDSLDDNVSQILQRMSKSSGFFAGVAFTFSLFGAALGAVITLIVHFTGGHSH